MLWEYELLDHTQHKEQVRNPRTYDYELFDNHPYDISQSNNQSYYKILLLLYKTQITLDESGLGSSEYKIFCLFVCRSQRFAVWFLQTFES